MKKIKLILFLFMVSCKHDYTGTYSVCWGDNPTEKGCHFIILSDDKTFTYSNPFYVSGNAETSGVWSISNDSLVLNNEYRKFIIRGKNSEISSSDSVTVGILQKYKDQISNCGLGKIHTDSSYYRLTDSLGLAKFERNSFDSLSIECIGCFRTWIQIDDSIKSMDSILIYCNTEIVNQMEFKNEKWRIYNDTIFIQYGNKVVEKLIKKTEHNTGYSTCGRTGIKSYLTRWLMAFTS